MLYSLPVDGKTKWLIVTRSNNLPEVSTTFYLNYVTEHGVCPVKVQSEYETDSCVTSAMQCEFWNNVCFFAKKKKRESKVLTFPAKPVYYQSQIPFFFPKGFRSKHPYLVLCFFAEYFP